MVQAWAADDDEAMDEAWFDGITVDLGSDYGAYEYVMNIARDGGYAEYVTAPVARVHDMTESPLTDDQLA
ncbi:hypothetical protein [Streptomyces aureus]|uniref:Uncharacterized protein n=1 Tax=Streptomyces aureus TaxID=193461 RepID=A0ABV4SYP9_9ACTN